MPHKIDRGPALPTMGSARNPRSRSVRVASTSVVVLGVLLAAALTRAGDNPGGPAGYESDVMPFLKSHCVKCHGPERSKGEVTLHNMGELSRGRELERWELILQMLESGEMPPEDQPQPGDVERKAVIAWIEASLREQVVKQALRPVPGTESSDAGTGRSSRTTTTRRLTNFEYQNTMRDLFGFELKLIDNLPVDPVKPYRFNNTAEFMRMGPEQIDRYLESARRVLASAIVAPEKPEVHRTRREWKFSKPDEGLGANEIGVYGNRRNTPAWGMQLRSFPATGEFRVRIKASAILPPGVTELPLRLVMGYGLNVNSSTLRIEPIGTVDLSNSPDQPEVFEFRGRIENFPVQPGGMKNGQRQPDTLTITPQNLYDDGTLNDENGFHKVRNPSMPRAVVEWIEFEAAMADVWPPEHHTRILFESPLRESDPPAYVRAVLKRFLSRAFRRPAAEEEVERFARIYEVLRPELPTLEAAMRETLAMVLVSPQFLYHTDGEELSSRQYILASKLSYFFWGSMPDHELLQLASDAKLDDNAEIERQVRRLLADDRSGDFVRNFSMQWLGLAKMKTIPINRELFPRFLYYVPLGERAGTEEPYRPTIRDYMIQETIGFVAELIRRNSSVLNIVDSDFACLNQPLAAHYGVEGVQGHKLRPVALEPEHRLGGLLTHGSVLIGNGTGSAPHPIYRAVWLREAILGDEVSPPPADVPALSDSAGESAETALTIKDLLAKHRQTESCNDCHARLDPWGIPFERYNAIGKYQPFVPKQGTRVTGFDKKTHNDLTGYAAYLESINTLEIQADARVPHGPSIDGMRELKAYLLQYKKDVIAENVLRRLLSYGIGRKLTWRDRFAVEELLEQSQRNEYGLRDMIVSICQSNIFRGE